ncbi:MAG: hypothetical protein Kow0075_07840 [Salibacteraceae bacterium]
MKNAIRFIVALFVFSAFEVEAQQDLTLYNMRYLQQSSFTNPAYFGECKVNVGIPLLTSYYFRLGHSGFTLLDIATLNSNNLNLSTVNPLNEMKDLNYLDQEFRSDLIHFGFRLKDKNYLSLNLSARQSARLTYPKDLFVLAFIGNGFTPEEAAENEVLQNSEYGLLGQRANLNGLAFDFFAFSEIGLQYARNFMDDDRLTIGVRPKLLFGAMNFYTRESEFGLYTDPNDYSLAYDGNLVINSNLPIDTTDSSLNFSPNAMFKNIGFGIDLGATFNITEKFQVSASVTDLGFITWKDNPISYYLVGTDTFRGVNGIEQQLIGGSTDTAGITEAFIDGLIDGFSDSTQFDKYRTRLTARYNIGLNYQFADKHNVGLLLNAHTVRKKLRAAMTLSYNFRVRKWFGLSLNYSMYNRSFLNFGAGMSFNIFPFQFYVLTDNILAPFVPFASRNAHLRFGINMTFGCQNDKDKDGIVDKLDDCPREPGVPQLNGCPDRDGDGIADADDACPDDKGPKETNGCPDRDGDGILDKDDACPDAPGIAKFQGCPDTDEDGIKDSEDECPTAAGVPEFNGCPDTDKDGIRDSEDACPQVPGIAKFNGCPDTDEDGIQDSEDACPEKAGKAEFNGCPDTDGDGLPDNKDNCPEAAGPKENNGCPYGDRDGDGVIDKDDNCPDNPGPAENKGCPYADLDGDGVLDKDDACIDTPGPADNNGCPYADLDGDGVLDKDDRCPQTPGPADNQGCPKIEKEEQEVINTAFENLEFETGKDKIKERSFESLDRLAELLIKKEDWKIRISGHTDNVGNDAANMVLSEKRAKAVANYLESRGVPRDRMVVQWFGETKPIADNSTPEGRARNRRVEMEIIFD